MRGVCDAMVRVEGMFGEAALVVTCRMPGALGGGLDGAGALAFCDEFPEVFAFGEDFVFWAGDFAAVAEEEVGEGIFVEDAVDAV
jgi:hypothetical protein